MAVTSRRRESAVIPTALAMGAGLVAFLLLIQRAEGARDAAVVAAIAAALTALIFLIWSVWVRRHSVTHRLGGPLLGQIPQDSTTSTFAESGTEVAAAYEVAANELEARTNGQVVLVTSAGPGQGTSRTALNLAAAATRSGRHVVLVDGDPTQNGLSRFGRTGSTPGLAELARGEADLAMASRLWAIGADHRLPFIPSGEGDVPGGFNGAGPMAEAVGILTDGADLVLIDVPPLGWNTSAQPLATHADGSVLVVTESSDAEAIGAARQSLDDAGAPVIGYVVNRANAQLLHHAPIWRRTLWRALATFVVAAVLFVGWNAYQIWDSWQNVERDALDVLNAQELLPIPPTGITAPEQVFPEQVVTAVTSTPVDAAAFRSFLVVGSDEGGARADVIILALFPKNSDQPVMLSLPRDLYLPNRCGSTYSRINATLAGCGSSVNGPTLLALAVEDFTGIAVDHFALFDFDGFERIIDKLGGVEICVDRAVRDAKSFLDLPAGCTNASGEQSLAWVRSRSTEELRNGEWRDMRGVNDLTRNERQQDVILAMFAKLRKFDSPSQLSSIVESLTTEFTLDDQLGVGDAISLAWSLRSLNADEITRLRIPVRDFTADNGDRVLLPTAPFSDVLRDARPDLVADPI